MSLLAPRSGASDRLQILTSLAYLAVEAENSGDQSLGYLLRSAFSHGISSRPFSENWAITHADTEASLNFLISFLGSTPSLQASIIALLERGEAAAYTTI